MGDAREAAEAMWRVAKEAHRFDQARRVVAWFRHRHCPEDAIGMEDWAGRLSDSIELQRIAEDRLSEAVEAVGIASADRALWQECLDHIDHGHSERAANVLFRPLPLPTPDAVQAARDAFTEAARKYCTTDWASADSIKPQNAMLRAMETLIDAEREADDANAEGGDGG